MSSSYGSSLYGPGGPIDTVTGGPVFNVTVNGGNTFDYSNTNYLQGTLNVTFAGPGTVIVNVGQPSAGGLTLDSFHNADTTEVAGFSGWNAYTVSVSSPAGGTTTDTITFTGSPAGSPYALTFTHVPIGDTITAAQDSSNAANTDIICTACFLSGTAIATADGARPVETLAPGDRVLLVSGESQRVVWTGWRTVRASTLKQPELTRPVRITAGAIADGVPRRDLLVTPDHAVLVAGHLLPARLLVNGTTIRSEAMASYTFHHVELETHEILLAEGMGAESYLDTGNRPIFAGHDVVSLQGAGVEAPRCQARACRPLTLDPDVTGAIWCRLADRAAALGRPVSLPATTSVSDLRIEAGGRRFRPVHADPTSAVFALPAGLTEVVIASRASMPWALSPWIDDRRTLGVAIERILLRVGDAVHAIALDSPAIGAGWWRAETVGLRTLRWTDGKAYLTLPAGDGPIVLELGLAGTARYAMAEAPSAGDGTKGRLSTVA